MSIKFSCRVRAAAARPGLCLCVYGGAQGGPPSLQNSLHPPTTRQVQLGLGPHCLQARRVGGWKDPAVPSPETPHRQQLLQTGLLTAVSRRGSGRGGYSKEGGRAQPRWLSPAMLPLAASHQHYPSSLIYSNPPPAPSPPATHHHPPHHLVVPGASPPPTPGIARL